MTSKQMLRLYKKNGWKLLRIAGGHYHVTKNNKFETIPFHNKDLKKGTQSDLLKTLKEVG
jgi:predicted RNA binding protein YcfA (HicA-like mRNA interferase family)